MDLSHDQQLLDDCRTHLKNTAKANAFFYGYPIVPREPWLAWNSQSVMVDSMAGKFLGVGDLNAAGRIVNAFYQSGVVNEYYSVKDPTKTNQWPAEQHYSRLSAAMGWVPNTMRADAKTVGEH
jgi:hypothetical protein